MPEPKITLQAYHVSAGANAPMHRVVIHATAPGSGFPSASEVGQAAGTARYFQSPSSGGSAHYVQDPKVEEHCVRESAIAWHAPPNTGSIGIECCGEASYTHDQWMSANVKKELLAVAKRTADLCHRYSIPVQKLGPHELLAGKRGICGHVDVSQAWHQSDHTDPGPHFPWPWFIKNVKFYLTKLQGSPDAPSKVKPKAPAFPGRVLHLGSHGDDVHTYQMQMIYRGWTGLGRADVQFGPKCVAVTREFQKEKKLPVTGRVDKATWDTAFKAKIT